MLFQILLCAKRAEAALSGGYTLNPTATFCTSKLSLFPPENAQISSLNPMEMLWR